MTTNSPLLSADGVSRVYGGDGGWLSSSERRTVTAVDDISLAVEAGDVVGLSGPSGSGKSTLLHLLAGLDVPSSGEIRVRGSNIANFSSGERSRFRLNNVGIVFQRFHLLPSLSARSNVALPLVELGVGRRERRRRADALLEEVGLTDRADHRPATLSGGEQQRVALARALVTDPPLLVADEPTGELDTETGALVLDLLVEQRGERAVIIASHDERALSRTDRLIELLDGRRVDDE